MNKMNSKVNKNRSSSVRRSQIPQANRVRSSSSNRNDMIPSTCSQQPRLSRMSSVSCSTLTRSAKDHKCSLKDPRPISDKNYKESVIRELIEFLLNNGYPNAVNQKLLQSPSNSDFRNIVNFMFGLLPIGGEAQLGTNFEESFPDLMLKLAYPTPIPKRMLKTVGVPHQWPHLLLTLDYIKTFIDQSQLISVDTQFNANEQKFFNCVEEYYRNFLHGQDFSSIIIEEFKQNFVENVGLKEENDKMQEEITRLKKQDALNDQMIAKLENELKMTEKSVMKTTEQIETCKQKRLKREEMVARKTAEVQTLEEKVKIQDEKEQEMCKELESVQKIIKAQESLGFDVYKLHSDIQIKEGENRELEARITTSRDEMRAIMTSVGSHHKKIRDSVDAIKQELGKLGLSAQRDFVFELRLDPKDTTQFEADFMQLKNVLNGVRSEAIETNNKLQSNIHKTTEQISQVDKDKEEMERKIVAIEKQMENLASLQQQLLHIHNGEVSCEKAKTKALFDCIEEEKEARDDCITRNNQGKKNLAVLKDQMPELRKECKRYLSETIKVSKDDLKEFQTVKQHHLKLNKMCMAHIKTKMQALFDANTNVISSNDGTEDEENKEKNI